MSNIVTWFRPVTIEAARLLCQKFAVYNKIVRGARRFDWGPIYQDTDPDDPEAAAPAVFAIEPDTTFDYANATWPASVSVDWTFQGQPGHMDAIQGDPLFTSAELATIGGIDIEPMFENYDIIGGA